MQIRTALSVLFILTLCACNRGYGPASRILVGSAANGKETPIQEVEEVLLTTRLLQAAIDAQAPTAFALTDYTPDKLRKRVTIHQHRDTSLLSIEVALRDGELAAQTANTLAKLVKKHYLDLDEQIRENALEDLKTKLRTQQANIDNAEKAVAGLRNETETPAYFKAREEVRKQREILNAMRAQMASVGIEDGIPRSRIEIIELAEPLKR